ncbi:adenosylmethionine decarboxylase [Staphylothermus hellenicus]|uniref:S-adenosylmethionine decarboxylase proenzyme n=1 Tax=Staphylothermus hellenicus (strain DSM 12710 / JCM 10830 / BK20S6-10-b1 / P8) TaxID=591019 RepID=D7D8K5_STAHD|nr:adenosylmethionine decarboxylase [Staphylothermus hellenicus]ADI32101.1 S-adenosylmethionine decarboxylase proenzyme [Staphylothermus hellenicus DSM 12710]
MLTEREVLRENDKKLVIGKHVYGELYGCDPEILSNAEKLVEIVRKAAEIGGFTLLDVKAWHIYPGVSVVGIVLESHISIHTWPEYGFATVDVYTCGETGDPVSAYLYIVKSLRAKKYTLKTSDRSYEWV